MALHQTHSLPSVRDWLSETIYMRRGLIDYTEVLVHIHIFLIKMWNTYQFMVGSGNKTLIILNRTVSFPGPTRHERMGSGKQTIKRVDIRPLFVKK